VYATKEPLFSIETKDGLIGYRVQLWFSRYDQKDMIVQDQYDDGDGVALSGGRPESNRRKF
jgi:hypothetical protein